MREAQADAHGGPDPDLVGLEPAGAVPSRVTSLHRTTSTRPLAAVLKEPSLTAADSGLGGVCGHVGALAPAEVLRRGQGDNVFPSPCGRRGFCAALRGRRDRRHRRWVTPQPRHPTKSIFRSHGCGSGGPLEALFLIVSRVAAVSSRDLLPIAAHLVRRVADR